jgi:hypothetical protein
VRVLKEETPPLDVGTAVHVFAAVHWYTCALAPDTSTKSAGVSDPGIQVVGSEVPLRIGPGF